MKRTLLALLLMTATLLAGAADPVPSVAHVRLETTEGDIVLELDGRRAPLTVANFLKLVESGYYDGTIFHRVVPDFVLQGGGYDRDFVLRESGDAVPNESGNGLRNLRGTVSLARLSDPHTGVAQFFINLADNRTLDPQPDRWGYAVFGYVIEGIDVIDKIAAVRTGPGGQFPKDVPVTPVILTKATRIGN